VRGARGRGEDGDRVAAAAQRVRDAGHVLVDVVRLRPRKRRHETDAHCWRLASGRGDRHDERGGRTRTHDEGAVDAVVGALEDERFLRQAEDELRVEPVAWNAGELAPDRLSVTVLGAPGERGGGRGDDGQGGERPGHPWQARKARREPEPEKGKGRDEVA